MNTYTLIYIHTNSSLHILLSNCCQEQSVRIVSGKLLFHFPTISKHKKALETEVSRAIIYIRLCIRNYYSMISLTTPEPTVRPPSRIAKRSPASIATGWISSHVISMWSPGMHISVPSGSPQTPVTSVVLK